MTDSSSRFESLVDQQIRSAQERGEFDDLPGMGKPLPGRGRPDDDLWWVRQYLEREKLPSDALLPTSLQLAREAERLPEDVRDLPSEQVVRERVRDLNRRVAEYLRAPKSPFVPVRPVNADAIVAQWREGWELGRPAASSRDPGGDTEPAGRDAASRARRGARRRWFRRRPVSPLRRAPLLSAFS